MDSRRPVVELALRPAAASTGAWRSSVVLTLADGGLAVFFNGGRLPGARAALPAAVARRAADRVAHQPHSARGGEVRPVAGQQRELRLIARRTWRFFETFVTAEDNHLPPDNFQEDPRARRRAPHLAHQHRPLSAVDGGGARFRLVRPARRARPHRGHARHDGAHAQVSRAPVQLVRHARPAAARSPLRVVGRLGQPRRASHHARRRVPRMAEKRRRRPRRPSTASPIRSTWRARRCAHFRFSPGLTITQGLLETAFNDLETSLRPRTMPLDPQTDALREAAERASTLVDMVRTLASESDASSAAPNWCTGSKPRAAPSTAGAAICWRAIRPVSSSSTSSRWPTSPCSSPRPWSSASCSTRSASCCRSAIAPPTARSTTAATTCSPPRRASPASSPSPRATFRRGTGSGSAAPSRPSARARRWCPGRARCSST